MISVVKRVLATAILTFAFAGAFATAQNQPNVIVILADDIGVGDISFYTQKFTQHTPVVLTKNIDQLAQQGIWFTDAHSATALCAPTRFAVMSGKNNYRSYAPWGVWGSFQPNAIKDKDITLASVAKQAEYNAGFVGKWHLGGDFRYKQSDKIYRGTDEGHLPDVDVTHMHGGGPNDLGFDYSFMLPDGIQGPLYIAYENQKWYPLGHKASIEYLHEKNISDPRIISDKGDGMGDTHWKTEDIGDLISKKATDYIDKQSVEKPFFLYYASPMAHRPHIPPKTFDGVKVEGTTPSRHLDMVFELDLQVGRIVNSLKKNGFYKNTLIIFTSDNGGLMWKVPGTLESGHKPSGIYRGSKNTPHEGGHRIPFIAVWPDKIKPQSIKHEGVLVQDILATFSAATGQITDTEKAPDSNNLLPLLTAQKGFKAREYMMLQGGSRNELIYREQDWKLIINSSSAVDKFEPVALFNLADNIGENEHQNRINEALYQQKVASMLSRYLSIRNSAMPTVN